MRESIISKETGEEILEYYKNDFTLKEIAEITGINKSTLNSWLTRTLPDEMRNRKRGPKPGFKNNKPEKPAVDKLHDIEEAISTFGEADVRALENHGKDPVHQEPRPVVKEKTLKDFTAREMITHLYKMGYRIENNTLVVLQKVPVKLNDIIKDIING